MPMRLLIASLGNPAPYTNTLHSAGHALIEALRILLDYPPFSHDSLMKTGAVSQGPQFTLFQSPSYMNKSGPAVAKAYRSFLYDLSVDERSNAGLVIVHDDLEAPLGRIRMRKGGSARGHNGLKSCISSLGANDTFTRLGVGIGRPESRESGAVSSYVLREMKSQEIQAIRAGATDAAALLEKLATTGEV